MDDDLAKIAAAYGVATAYRDGDRRPVTVAPDAVMRVLGLLEVDATTPQARSIALAGARERTPATLAARPDEPRPLAAPGVLVDESGTRKDVTEIPAGLTPGWYRLETDDGTVTVVAPPRALPAVPRSWGWMLQLYALHSPASWGLGDLGDLRTFVNWTGPEHGASAVLLNPLHAITPVPPVQPSPYTPSSRRFGTPLALRVTDLDAYAHADPATRAEVDALRPEPVGGPHRLRPQLGRQTLGHRAAVARGGPARAPDAPPPTWSTSRSSAPSPNATGAGGAGGPEELRHPSSPAVARAAAELAPRVAYHAWLQGEVQRQLGDVRAAAREVGVRVVHDLAVGCDPEGFDGWALAGRPRAGRAGRRPAGRVQPAGPGLGAAAVAPRPAGRHRLRRLPRPRPRAAPAGRRAARRPRRRAVPAVVGAAGRSARRAARTSTPTPRSCSPCSRWRRTGRARW